MSVQSDRVRRLMQMVSYKPGWRMTVVDYAQSVYRPYEPDYKIVLVYPSQDPQDPRVVQWFTYHRDWCDCETERATDAFVVEMVIINTLKYAEQEEFDKWIRFNGQRFTREFLNASSRCIDPQQPRTNQEVRTEHP